MGSDSPVLPWLMNAPGTLDDGSEPAWASGCRTLGRESQGNEVEYLEIPDWI